MNLKRIAARRLSRVGAGNLLAMLVGLSPLAARAQADAPPATPPSAPPAVRPPRAAALWAGGQSCRAAGVVIGGDFMEGMLKYMAGAFTSKNPPETPTSPAVPNNAADPTATPLYSGRLQLALLAKEPGFWGNGSYF